jgi:hypothetical protein
VARPADELAGSLDRTADALDRLATVQARVFLRLAEAMLDGLPPDDAQRPEIERLRDQFRRHLDGQG